MRTRIEVRSRATGKLIASHEENRRMTAKEIGRPNGIACAILIRPKLQHRK